MIVIEFIVGVWIRAVGGLAVRIVMLTTTTAATLMGTRRAFDETRPVYYKILSCEVRWQP
jgi:hypothetical protein